MQRPLSPFMFPTWAPLPDHLHPFDPAPAHRDCSLGRLDPPRVVARRRGSGWAVVHGDSCFHRLTDRHAAAVPLVGGLLLSPVQRNPASRPGWRLWLPASGRLSQRLRRPGSDRAADRTHLALCISGLEKSLIKSGDCDGKCRRCGEARPVLGELDCAARWKCSAAGRASR